MIAFELEALRDEATTLVGAICRVAADAGSLALVNESMGRLLVRINGARGVVGRTSMGALPVGGTEFDDALEAIVDWAQTELQRKGRRKNGERTSPGAIELQGELVVARNQVAAQAEKLNAFRDVLQAINVRAAAVLGEVMLPSPASVRQVERLASRQARTKPADFSIRGALHHGGLRAGAVRMLEELSAFRPLGLTRHQVGFLAKVKSTSGTFSTYWGELRALGYLEERPGDRWTCTEKAMHLMRGPALELATPKGRADRFRVRLRAGARRMLEEVERCPAHGMNREVLGARAQVQSTSGTFSTYLGELVNNDLVVAERGGAVRLHPWLVEGREA